MKEDNFRGDFILLNNHYDSVGDFYYNISNSYVTEIYKGHRLVGAFYPKGCKFKKRKEHWLDIVKRIFNL